MKKLTLPLFILIGLLTGCLGYNEYLVESDYSYYGKFRNYKTFNFMTRSISDFDSSMQNPVIEQAIKIRLQQQGYRISDNKPNLLVSYKLFYEDFDFNGYNQPDIEDWVEIEDEEEEYDPIKYNLREGTLLVLLFDRKREKSIWQGYASGVFGGVDQSQLDKNMRRAVRSIFDRYQFLAEGFVVDDEGD